MITTEAAVMTALAAAVAFWPQLAQVAKVIPIPKVPVLSSVVSYQAAMLALATVRSRLVVAGGPSKAANEAIGTITQELVSGSDK